MDYFDMERQREMQEERVRDWEQEGETVSDPHLSAGARWVHAGTGPATSGSYHPPPVSEATSRVDPAE